MEWQFRGDQPIYAQIVQLMKLQIVSGALRPGERLPAVRDLAMEAGVNPNTMQRALTELERDGLVFAQRTSGRYVTDNEEDIVQVRRELARSQVAAFLKAMERLGYAEEEIPDLIAECKKEEQ